jgi:hypothetical protein
LSGLLVTRPFPESNVGSNLASLCGALWLARRLDRALVVDWRERTQLQDKSLNYFSEFFAAPSRMLGVEVSYAPVAAEYGRETGAAWLSPEQAQALGAGSAAEPDGPIVLEPYHGPDRLLRGSEAERHRVLRSFYRELLPAPEIERAVTTWAEERLDGAFVVGLNVRTGNGHYFGKGGMYPGRVDVSLFENPERFLRVLERACRARTKGLPKPLRDDFRIFYATDSAAMSELLGRLPNAVTRRRVFPPPDSGDTFSFPAEGEYTDRDSIRDTIADMFLLARADAFVFNSSVFNQYARVVNGEFAGNQVHIQSLFARHRVKQLRARLRRGVARYRS